MTTSRLAVRSRMPVGPICSDSHVPSAPIGGSVVCRLAALVILFAAVPLLHAAPAGATTHLSTQTISTSTTWTVAGSPYVLDGNVTVGSAATLTIQPGVIVKFNGQLRQLVVNGVLNALGTDANPIYFTSLQDDSVGGDTGLDGPTVGAAEQWYRVQFSGSGSFVQHAIVHYGGYGTGVGDTPLRVSSSTTFDSVEVSQNGHAGVSVTSGGVATISNSTIKNNSKGIHVLNGVVKVDHTTIENNSSNAAYFAFSNYVGAPSTFFDNTIQNNASGFYLTLPSPPASSKPYGHRNNFIANGGAQGRSLPSNSTGSDWRDNYWGSNGTYRANSQWCTNTGFLTYSESLGGGSPTSPIYLTQYTAPSPHQSTICWRSTPAIGSAEFSRSSFEAEFYLLGAEMLGGEGASDYATIPFVHAVDPVNTGDGNFVHQVTDLDFPGAAAGQPCSFVRSYNSLSDRSGSLGFGWSGSFGDSLSFSVTGDATFRAASGASFFFTEQPDGSFQPAPGVTATLLSVPSGYELTRADQIKLTFDSAGKLIALNDRNGQGETIAYDGSGRVQTVSDSVGRQMSFAYDASGRLSQLASSDGRSVTYTYNSSGRLATVTDVRGKVWTYTYDGNGLLQKETDPRSNQVFRNTYDTAGRVTDQYDAFDNHTTFAYDALTQTTTITDPRGGIWKDIYQSNVLVTRTDALGKETNFEHDNALNQTSVTGPDGNTTTMSYDVRGNLTHAVAPSSLNADKTITYDSMNNVTSVTDARGKITTYGYDANGNNTTLVQDGVTIATYTYNASGQVTSFKDGRNNTTTYSYDANGNLESETDALGNKTTYTHDAAGRMTSRTDPRGNVQGADPNQFRSTYTYDGAGRTLTETNPLGHVTTYAYDNAGNQTSVTDANNKTTTYAYDAANRVATITAPDAGVTTYTYDPVGNKLTQRDQNNKTTTYSYDADNRLANLVTPLGNKTTYSYDVSGNLIKEVEPRGNVQGANPDDYATTSNYDAAGRLITETDPLGNTTTYTYDAVGNKSTVKDANNHTTSYAYNGRNLLTSVTAPGGVETTYAYDAVGNLISRTDPGTHETTYVYDAANRLTTMTRPLNRQWTYGYDAAGNRTQVVDANGNSTQTAGDGTTTYAYDRAARLTAIDYSDSTPDLTYSYDAVGNRIQMTDGGTQTYSYDDVNRLAQVTRGADTFAYTYDLAGNLTRRTYPDSTVIDYTYDDDSRMASVVIGGQSTTYAYDAAGHVTQTTLPSGNGYVEERTYDRASRLTRVKSVKAASTLADFTYTLDPVGNPTQVVRAGNAPGTTTYTYDPRDQLTEVCFQASCPGGSDPFIRWTYDAVGNRLTETRPAVTTTYTYDAADELTVRGSMTYSYDQNGNETGVGGRTFAYDLANRLISATSGSATVTYTYDGASNRLQASTGSLPSDKTNYLWDPNGSIAELALERDGSGALLRRYVYGSKRYLSMTTSSSAHYYAYDALGSIANLTSSGGATEWTYVYEPFGVMSTETQDDPNAPANVLKFAGELVDSSGLYYLRARQYEPSDGRFLQIDPAPEDETYASMSSYVYASDQPTVLVDPTGMRSEQSDSGQGRARDTTSPASLLQYARCQLVASFAAGRRTSTPVRNASASAKVVCRGPDAPRIGVFIFLHLLRWDFHLKIWDLIDADTANRQNSNAHVESPCKKRSLWKAGGGWSLRPGGARGPLFAFALGKLRC